MDQIPASKRRCAFGLLCLLPALFVAFRLGISADADWPPAEPVPVSVSTQTSTSPESTSKANPAASEQTNGEDSVINILLVGKDSREGEDHCRSDSMILCTFHTGTHTLTMTSLLRDLYVPIPGQQSNRINAAYASGGTALLEQTIAENFGVTVDGSAEVDFTQFPRLIDMLGGVTLELRADEAEAIHAENPTEGAYLLNGEQALAYVRIRKLDEDGDFSRTSRQRKLLCALLTAYRDAGVPKLMTIIEESLSMVTTNMTKKQIFNAARQVLPMLSDLEVIQQHIPEDGTYSYQTIRGMCVLVADMDAARKLLADTTRPETN